jgi:hypothetical protein
MSDGDTTVGARLRVLSLYPWEAAHYLKFVPFRKYSEASANSSFARILVAMRTAIRLGDVFVETSLLTASLSTYYC